VDKREQIQHKAIEALLLNKDKNGHVKGTVEMITGLGKTFIALHIIRLIQPKNVLFLAETTV
jgi:superfamily II DNA or RNA helicase